MKFYVAYKGSLPFDKEYIIQDSRENIIKFGREMDYEEFEDFFNNSLHPQEHYLAIEV